MDKKGEKIIKYKDNNKSYLDDLLVRLVYNSVSIEGNSVTREETNSILLYDHIPKQINEREYHEVKNHNKAFNYMLDNKSSLTIEKIKNYHFMIMENLIQNNGEFKKIQNVILGSNSETTKPYKVIYVLKEWCDNLKYRLDNAKNNEEKLEAILSEHINFEKIHAFTDGNGRTGRLLIVDSCINENIIPVIIPNYEKGKYISILNNEDSNNFLKWGLALQKKEKERQDSFE